MPKIVLSSLLLVASMSIPALGQPNAYVVEFTTRDLEKSTLTANFTRDFEQALVQAGCYTVLESREFSRLLTELDRERAIADVADLSKSALDSLKAQQAEMVVFGEVFDDLNSGQVHVGVTFQKFDRTKVQAESILLTRGKVHDAESRREAMAELAQRICSGVGAPPRGAATLIEAFKEYGYEMRWTGGLGENVDMTRTSEIIGVEVSGNAVTIDYKWYNGIIYIKGVLEGVASGREYKGRWKERFLGHGPGNFSFKFNEKFSEADGWWDLDGSSGVKNSWTLVRIR